MDENIYFKTGFNSYIKIVGYIKTGSEDDGFKVKVLKEPDELLDGTYDMPFNQFSEFIISEDLVRIKDVAKIAELKLKGLV